MPAAIVVYPSGQAGTEGPETRRRVPSRGDMYTHFLYKHFSLKAQEHAQPLLLPCSHPARRIILIDNSFLILYRTLRKVIMTQISEMEKELGQNDRQMTHAGGGHDPRARKP